MNDIPVLRVGDVHEVEAFLAERIYEFNAGATGCFDAASFCATQHDEAGAIRAGICGYTWAGCCHVSHLWVEASFRRRGVGANLLRAAEQHAQSKGCRLMILSSHSFQSPAFYERSGFVQQAVVPDDPPGHADLVFVKRLRER